MKRCDWLPRFRIVRIQSRHLVSKPGTTMMLWCFNSLIQDLTFWPDVFIRSTQNDESFVVDVDHRRSSALDEYGLCNIDCPREDKKVHLYLKRHLKLWGGGEGVSCWFHTVDWSFWNNSPTWTTVSCPPSQNQPDGFWKGGALQRCLWSTFQRGQLPVSSLDNIVFTWVLMLCLVIMLVTTGKFSEKVD
jgi:hypothetical protein